MPLWRVLYVSNLLLFWLFIEIYNIFFICFCGIKKIQKYFIIYYFIVQGISSLVFLLRFFFSELGVTGGIANWGVFFSLLIKMGLIPFHNWMLKLVELLNFEDLFLFLVVIKIMPFFLIMNFFVSSNVINFFIILNLLISPVLMYFYNSLKKILVLSSVGRTSLIIFLIKISGKIFLFYFFLYYVFNFFIFFYIKILKLNVFYERKIFFDFNLFIIIFSIAGIPFILGFIIKWYMFYETLYEFSCFFIIIFYLMSVISSFFYFKLIFFFFNFLKFVNIQLFFRKKLEFFFLLSVYLLRVVFILSF